MFTGGMFEGVSVSRNVFVTNQSLSYLNPPDEVKSAHLTARLSVNIDDLRK